MATQRIRSATSASPAQLAPALPHTEHTPLGPALLSLHAAAHLSPSAQDALFALFDANISPLARDTSMHTPPGPKREEMFHRDARFLVLARTRVMPGSMPREANGSGSGRGGGSGNGSRNGSGNGAGSIGHAARAREPELVDIDAADLVGYASFRFDTEETMGPKDVEVVYCYELHLVPRARGAGLGALLMKELERIGRDRGMRKSMLTCLTDNTSALDFYARMGYRPDEIDPTRIADEDGWEDVDENGSERHCDYRILSKVLK